MKDFHILDPIRVTWTTKETLALIDYCYIRSIVKRAVTPTPERGDGLCGTRSLGARGNSPGPLTGGRIGMDASTPTTSVCGHHSTFTYK